jgi:hypothetical protein
MGCFTNEAHGGVADDVGGSEGIAFNALPTIEPHKEADVNGTNDDVVDAPLEKTGECGEISVSTRSSACFHNTSRVNGIVPSILHPSRLR